MTLELIQTDQAPAAIGPYSQGIKAAGFCFFSGQIPLDPDSMELVAGGIEAQTAQVMCNLRAALAAAGLDFSALVKTTIYMIDLEDFAAMNAVYAEHLGEQRPARATVQVAALPKGSLLEIEAVACCGG